MKLPSHALRTYLRDAREAFVHAPVEVTMGIALALAFSVAKRGSGGDGWVHAFAAAVIALPLVFGASVLRARGVIQASTRWGATALALVGAGAYAVFLFHPELESEMWRAAALAAAAWLALLLLPALGGEAGRRHRVWRFAALLLIRILAVGLYGAALFAALAGAVGAVSSLFALRTPAHLYEDIAGAIFFALVPWVVAGGVPLLAAEGPDRPEPAPVMVRRAGRYLYAVVLVVYLAILFAYTARVLATGELPKNLLSPIVLFAGLAGLLGGIFLEPLQGDAESRGVARLVRVFPALLLPLLPLPIWAIGVRQDQYGWTEFRLLRLAVLLALAVLAVWGTMRLVRRRPPLLSPVPAVLAAVLVLASIGPWSAQSVSRRDQSARLRTAMHEAGLMREGRLVRSLLPPGKPEPRPDSLPAEQYQRISGSIVYLREAHGTDAVERVLGTELDHYPAGWPMMQALAVRQGCQGGGPRHVYASLSSATGVPMGAGTVYLLETHRAEPAEGQPEGGVWLRVEGSTAVVAPRGGAGHPLLRAELAPLLQTLAARTTGACDQDDASARMGLADARVPLRDAAGRVRGELVVTSVRFSARGAAGTGPRAAHAPLVLDRVSGMAVLP